MSDAFTRREFLATTAAAAAILPPGALARGAESRLPATASFESVQIPEWIHRVSVMGFGSGGDLELMARAGVQVLHTNLIWPYYPLRRDGGGLNADDAAKLRELVAACRQHKMRLSLGLPPFPSVELVRTHPDWRIHDEPTGKILQVAPDQDNLGTRIGCNLGPWGDYLIEVCGELVEDFGVDGYSFDGNYHPPICYCPACRQTHEAERGLPLPKGANLDHVEYRRYLVWRGEKLEDHYRRLQQRIKRANSEAVLTSWTVNAGRFGHFLHSPRAMPTRMNLLFDLPMQEWWLDETNIGASVAPAFGAAYLHAVTNGRPCASEPYLMSRGNPYGTDSFPKHERLARTLLALTHGNVSAQSFGWPGHRESSVDVCHAVVERTPWMLGAEPVRWAAMLVSEQTRQFYAYRDIRERFLPHVFGAFRAALEEHLPLRLINDWDLAADGLRGFKVLVLPNAAALSDAQLAGVRQFVADGGGLVAIGETSLCNEWGESRGNFGLSDVFGVSFRGRPVSQANAAALDENFARTLDENYWKERVGLATLKWREHPLTEDKVLADLVPSRSVIFRGAQVLVSEPVKSDEVLCHLTPDGKETKASPALVARTFGKGKVVYLAAALDAALWSYGYPYQRRLLIRVIEWAAAETAPIRVQAPMCVQAGYFRQRDDKGERHIVHLFNNLNTTGQHGLPSAEVPLREETVPIAGIRVQFREAKPKRCHAEPGGLELPMAPSADGRGVEIVLPSLDLHCLIVAEF